MLKQNSSISYACINPLKTVRDYKRYYVISEIIDRIHQPCTPALM